MISSGLSVPARGLKWNKRLILRSIRVPSRGNCLTSRSSRALPEYISDVSCGGIPSDGIIPFHGQWYHPNTNELLLFLLTVKILDLRRPSSMWYGVVWYGVSESSNQPKVFRLFFDGYVVGFEYFSYWRWRQNVRPKPWCTWSGLHGVTSRKITLLLYIVITFCQSR